MIKEYKKQEIIGQDRHLFIYGRNGIERENFLRSLEAEYPIRMDESSPMAIYLDDYHFPMVSLNPEVKVDSVTFGSAAREYFHFTIVERILEKIDAEIQPELLNDRIEGLLLSVNKLYMRRQDCPVRDIKTLIHLMKATRNFYKKYYASGLKGNGLPNIGELIMPFIMIEQMIDDIKKMLKNSSYFAVIIDHQNSIPPISTRAINSLVNARCNGSLSMKVAIEPDEWETYIDDSGHLIEDIHDYGTVELDDSHKKYILKMKQKMSKE